MHVRIDHSGLGTMLKLKFSVIFKPECAAETDAEVFVACEH